MFHHWINSLNDFFGVDSKTTVPVLITLLVFLLTQVLIAIGNKLKESRKRKTIKRIIKKNLIELSSILRKEANNSLIASDIFSKRSNSNFKIVKSSFPQLSVFREIGYQDLFATYYKGLFNRFNLSIRIRAFAKLWTIVNDVQEWEDYRRMQLEKFNDLNNEQIRLFNKSHGVYIEYIYQLLLTNFQTEVEKQYVKELGAIHTAWLKSENHIDQDVVYDKLVKPSDELNKKYVTSTPHLALHCLLLLQEMDLNYRNRRQLLDSYSNVYAISHNFFLTELRRIDIITSILYPTLTLSFRRMFKVKKGSRPIKRPSSYPPFIAE